MKRRFVEISSFSRKLRELGGSELLRDIQNAIMDDPSVGPVIQGAGGIRKMRIATEGRGKSGGCRVLYIDFSKAKVTYLLMLFPKNQKDNISDEEKALLAKMATQLKKEVEK